MTVDSEAIFALAAHSRNEAEALEELSGSMAAAWLDEREPDTVFVARGAGRPLWLGAGKHELFFASTPQALEVVEDYAGVRLRKRELGQGTFLELRHARLVREERFTPDLSYRESVALPAVRAPGERQTCLQRLAVLYAAA
jgi:asparagine synthetase B (glutamine-hydrolysing)